MTASDEPTREAVDAMAGPVMLEFGTAWCGHCRAARPHIERALSAHPAIRHIRVEDGSGRRLGRTFGVKLWPTLVFLSGGHEKGRLVRPVAPEPIGRELAAIDPT